MVAFIATILISVFYFSICPVSPFPSYLKIFKVYYVMIWYTYILWKDPSTELINTSILHLTYLSLLWEHLGSIFLANFIYTIQCYHLLWLGHIYIKSSNLIHLINESLYPFTNLSLFLPTLCNHISALFPWVKLFSRVHIQVMPWTICLSLSNFTQQNAL